jgi:hypothetical protein
MSFTNHCSLKLIDAIFLPEELEFKSFNLIALLDYFSLIENP